MSEALFLRTMLLEAKLAKKVSVIAHTDSTAGKKTKHVELRLFSLGLNVAQNDPKAMMVETGWFATTKAERMLLSSRKESGASNGRSLPM